MFMFLCTYLIPNQDHPKKRGDFGHWCVGICTSFNASLGVVENEPQAHSSLVGGRINSFSFCLAGKKRDFFFSENNNLFACNKCTFFLTVFFCENYSLYPSSNDVGRNLITFGLVWWKERLFAPDLLYPPF